MSKSPGQSAMEYMLTYGWAILVVMVVGIVMWEIGIFNIGGSIPTTSDGFATLKPLLATCKVANQTWFTSYHGFQCMFTNTVGSAIRVKDITVTVNGQYCRYLDVHLAIPQGWTHGFLERDCELDYPDDCTAVASCDDGDALPRPCTLCSGGTVNCLTIAPDSTFFVSSHSWSSQTSPCSDIKPGKRYEVFVDITYEISMLGETVTKHSTGHIRGSME